MKAKLETLAAAMNKLGFHAAVYDTGADALDALCQALSDADSIGQGGSMTCEALGVEQRFVALGKTYYYHGQETTPEGVLAKRLAAHQSSAYILSANAVTTDGAIYNIDGYGNRVAASVSPHEKGVHFLIGRNKIVDGGYEQAMAHMKKVPCVLNAQRLHKQTPCVATGVCHDCRVPQRICNITMVLERPPFSAPTFVYLINEDLGY